MNKSVVAALVAAVFVIGALAASAATTAKHPICQGRSEIVVLMPFTSPSDLATSQKLTPDVAEQLVARAANSCSVLAGAVAGARIESDFAPRFTALTPKVEEAPNRKPYLNDMQRTGRAFLEREVLGPLRHAQARPGSPFLGALVKLGEEYGAQGHTGGLIVMVGDLIDIEPAPNGGMVDFRSAHVDQEALASFVPHLRPLAGACVVDVGAEAGSDLDPRVLRASRVLMGRVLRQAGIGFKAVAHDVPKGCSGT